MGINLTGLRELAGDGGDRDGSLPERDRNWVSGCGVGGRSGGEGKDGGNTVSTPKH